VYQSSTSPFYARYNGTLNEGASAILGFSTQDKDAWNSSKAFYSDVVGENILIGRDHVVGPESSGHIRIGNQGQWGAYASYDAITYYGNLIHSPYYPTGEVAPGLRAFGGAPSMTSAAGAFSTITAAGSASSYSAANFANALIPEQTGTRRDIFGGGFKYLWDGWTFTADYKHEHKEGTLEQSFYFGGSGLTTAMPINFDSERYDVKALYANKIVQAQFTYSFLNFRDNNVAFIAPDVFSGTANSYSTAFGSNGTPTAAIQQATMALSEMPSNSAHYLTGNVGYNLTSDTRLAANVRAGLELQNAPLPPAGGGASLFANPGYPLLASNPPSLSGLARVYQGNVTATSRPFANADIRAEYAFDMRDVDTSSYGISGMTHGLELGNFGPPALAGEYSVPQQWSKQKAIVEAGYRILHDTKVTVGYNFSAVDRSVAQVGRNNENTGLVKITQSIPAANVTATAQYSHSDRTASAVHADLPWQAFENSSSAGYPSITFYQAARVQDAVKLRASWTPQDEMNVSLRGRLVNNTYTYPAGIIGNARDYVASIGSDLTYSPTARLSGTLFYTYDEIYYGNRGAGAPYWINGGYGWSASSTDTLHTVGLSTDYKISDKAKVSFAYTYATGDVAYNLFDGVTTTSCTPACGVSSAAFVNVVAPPTIGTTMHSLMVNGQYEVSPRVTLIGGYQYSMFKDQDWAYTAWQSVTQTSATGYQVTSGAQAPVDHVSVVIARVRVKF
jgi:MtrB/PioB family decaheme-associated outer membrane protein